MRQQLIAADTTTKISDNVEAYFLLKLSGLSKSQRSQVLASCANVYAPALMGEAMRVQFADLHKSEGRFKEHGHHGKGRGRYAYLADLDYEDEKMDWETAAAAVDDQELD